MCYTVYHTHAECGHNKKVEIFERCEYSEGGTCVSIPLGVKNVTTPSLCISCFREEEARIDNMYHARVEFIYRKMAEYEATQADRQIKGRAQRTVDGYIAQLERDLKDAKKERVSGIRTFRTQQGVWADG